MVAVVERAVRLRDLVAHRTRGARVVDGCRAPRGCGSPWSLPNSVEHGPDRVLARAVELDELAAILAVVAAAVDPGDLGHARVGADLAGELQVECTLPQRALLRCERARQVVDDGLRAVEAPRVPAGCARGPDYEHGERCRQYGGEQHPPHASPLPDGDGVDRKYRGITIRHFSPKANVRFVPRGGAENSVAFSGVLVRDRAAAGLGGVALLVGAVAASARAGPQHAAEAEHLALLAEPAELVRVHPAVDRGVVRSTAGGTARS